MPALPRCADIFLPELGGRGYAAMRVCGHALRWGVAGFPWCAGCGVRGERYGGGGGCGIPAETRRGQRPWLRRQSARAAPNTRMSSARWCLSLLAALACAYLALSYPPPTHTHTHTHWCPAGRASLMWTGSLVSVGAWSLAAPSADSGAPPGPRVAHSQVTTTTTRAWVPGRCLCKALLSTRVWLLSAMRRSHVTATLRARSLTEEIQISGI